jgi:hypothetical protein
MNEEIMSDKLLLKMKDSKKELPEHISGETCLLGIIYWLTEEGRKPISVSRLRDAIEAGIEYGCPIDYRPSKKNKLTISSLDLVSLKADRMVKDDYLLVNGEVERYFHLTKKGKRRGELDFYKLKRQGFFGG